MPNHHIAEGETWAQALRRAQAESRSSSNGRDRQPLPAVVRALLDGVVGAASWRARCYARRPAATVAVNDLEKRRLVVRRTNPDNRRCKIVSMTVAGRDVVGALEAIDDPAPAGLAALNDDDLTVQLDVMNRLAEQLRADGRAKAEEDARRIVENARREIEAERQKALDSVRAEVADLVVAATERVIGESLDITRQRQLIERAISEVTSDGRGRG